MARPNVAPRVSTAARKAYTCNFCQTVVDDEAALRMARDSGAARDASCFCSTRCSDCVQALEALHPSPLAPFEFREARGVLTDGLLALWRAGRGPDPKLVLQAVERAASRQAGPLWAGALPGTG